MFFEFSLGALKENLLGSHMSEKETNANIKHLESGTSGWTKFMISQTMMPLWLLVIVVGQAASIYRYEEVANTPYSPAPIHTF